ncbi:hypothetical protein ACFDR9_001349 [Janthinobacterium sp. CG_23.3]|uniref:hypothetical protein n=1 Tax=unclassified Janthinobacterium TaxID=2610881 RepID=UPI0012FB1482|nr:MULTISPECIES: hypothetical protein [unclassified Janthinobacterium]MEC5160341.1 hypothetical protein [Janthinobacterium sp. CG_S6]
MKSRQLAVLMIAGIAMATQLGSMAPPKRPWPGATMVAFSGEPSGASNNTYPRQ